MNARQWYEYADDIQMIVRFPRIAHQLFNIINRPFISRFVSNRDEFYDDGQILLPVDTAIKCALPRRLV